MGTPAFSPPLPFARPKLPPFSAAVEKFQDSWEKASLTKGPVVRQYETEAARRLQVGHAVAVSSGTTGLILGLSAIGIQGECIVPSFTFTSTVSALLWNNLKPVFADCHPARFTLDVQALPNLVTPRTGAVLATYVFGNPPPLAALAEFCARRKLPLILDAAHALGTRYSGKPAGSFGDLEIFSTSATKLLCTGEGGILTTKDIRLAETLRSLREYGHGQDYEIQGLGLNGRLTEFQGLLGLLGLEFLEDHAARRNHLARLYQKALRDLPLSFQEIEPSSRSSYKDFAALLEGPWASKRDEVAGELMNEGIPTRKYFHPPLHRQAFFQERGLQAASLPITEDVCRRILCLPMFYDLREEEVEKIGAVLRRIYKRVA